MGQLVQSFIEWPKGIAVTDDGLSVIKKQSLTTKQAPAPSVGV